MRRRRRKAAAPAAALLLGFCWAFVATLCSAAAAAPSPSPLASLGTTEDTIPGLPSPVPLDRSPLPRTSLLGYPEGAKFPLKDLLEEQTRTFFPPTVTSLPMTDIVLRVVGPGAADLGALRRAVADAVPSTFKEDSNISASVLWVRPAGVVPVVYAQPAPGALPFPPAGSPGDGDALTATAAAADVALSLSLSSDSAVHLTSPINVDYGFARLLEARLGEALAAAPGARDGVPDPSLRVLPVLNTTYLRPAAPILLRLPRQTLVAVVVTLALRGDPAPGTGLARLLPFDGARQTALLEVVDTLLTNRTGLVQASLDGVVARAGGPVGKGAAAAASPPPPPPPSRRSLRAVSTPSSPSPSSPPPLLPYDEVNATIFLLSASSAAGVREALQAVLTLSDRAAVATAGDGPMLIQGLALEGLAATGAEIQEGADGLDEAVTRAPRFQLAALAGGGTGESRAAVTRRRVIIAVVAALAGGAGVLVLAGVVVLAVRARRRAAGVGGGGTKTSGGTAGSGGSGGGGAGGSNTGMGSGSSLTNYARGGIFAAMLGAGGPSVKVPPPTLRRAQPDEDGEGEEGDDGKKARKPLPPPPAASSDAEWEVDPGDLTIATRPDGTDWLLGTGGAGAVFRGTRGGVGDVAIKLLQRGTARDRAALAAEARLLRRVSRDAGVVQFYGACLTGPCPLLVLEYMAGGDLYAAIGESASAAAAAARARKGGRGGGSGSPPPPPSSPAAALPSVQWWAAGRRLALDVARGLHFLHSSRVRHGDLKSSNILLTAGRAAAKIGDVGLAKVLGSHTTAAAGGGTYAYAAPEVLMNARCDERSDMWSFGVLVWELCTLGRPERGGMRAVAVPAEAPPAILDLIKACMDNDPDARPTAKEAYDAIAASPESASGVRE